MLLDTGRADVTAEDYCGLTALQLAAFRHYGLIQSLLMENGASIPPEFYGLKALYS